MPDDLAVLTADIRTRVTQLGFELVDVRQGGSRTRVRLQVRVDRPDAAPGRGITVDECAIVSRALERWLDETAVFGSRYVLEVSSPGIERPVRWPEHWRRFIGREVRVTLPELGRVHATIMAVDEAANTVVLRPRGAESDVTVSVDDARHATLVVDWDNLRVSHK